MTNMDQIVNAYAFEIKIAALFFIGIGILTTYSARKFLDDESRKKWEENVGFFSSPGLWLALVAAFLGELLPTIRYTILAVFMIAATVHIVLRQRQLQLPQPFRARTILGFGIALFAICLLQLSEMIDYFYFE